MANNQNELEQTTEVDSTLQEEVIKPEDNPELFDDEITVNITANEETIKAIELLFAPNLDNLRDNNPELFGYYTLFGAAEGLIRSAKLLSYAAPDHPELAEAIANISKVISKTGIEIFNDTKEYLETQEYISPATLLEKAKLDSDKVKNIMDAISKIDVSLPDHLK